MDVFRTAAELAGLDEWRAKAPLTLVPTMGALHAGHLSLVRSGVEHGPVVVSIFVNPTQFGPHEDLSSYPRDEAKDFAALAELGVKAVYAPQVAEMYGADVSASVEPGSRGIGLCSGDRPGHFSGVLTIVAKLFAQVKPDVAIFGRKDAQQCLVIDQMVAEMKLVVRLIDMPTVRDDDGLALSSRNLYLSATQRRQALCLSRALTAARQAIAGGERGVAELRELISREMASADKVEYIEIRRVPNLEPLTAISREKVLLAVAARIGPARLIDNLVLDFAAGVGCDSHLLGSW